jgi:hypothetical protein
MHTMHFLRGRTAGLLLLLLLLLLGASLSIALLLPC